MDDGYFMRKALDQARQALRGGEFPVGCVVVRDRRVVASGARRGTAGGRPNEIDHAEMVALRRLVAAGPDMVYEDLTVYCTMEPCLMCFAALTLNRIGRVVYAYEDVMGGGTRCDSEAFPTLYRTLQPQVVGGVLRSESLELFQTFFADPANVYWKGSALAAYTREQSAAEAPPPRRSSGG